MTTAEIIKPIIVDAYGGGEYNGALIKHLAQHIDNFEPLVYVDAYPPDEQLAREILLIVWDWRAGGDTAASTTDKIMSALGHA